MNNSFAEKPAFGYLWSSVRIEHRLKRPGMTQYSREELLEILDILQKNGVKAWWYSVSAKGGYPYFKSKTMPYLPDAVDPQEYVWLSEEVHKRGMALVSWEYLSVAPLLMEKYPDWRMRFIRNLNNDKKREYFE